MSKVRALVLMSGGLDSLLAARVLLEQGVEVVGLSFQSNFFDTFGAKKSAEQLGIDLKEVDFSKEHLEMVKNPKYGYGKNMNPCIDCHSLMLRQAKKIMEDEGFDFVATGEVLGQRPMSQNRESLDTVAKYSGLDGLLLRPLSAKLLDETLPEKNGKIKRGKLHHLSGRTREGQMELVDKYGIKNYASPAGGCLLTDPEFGNRLIKMFDAWSDCDGNDVGLLKSGRIFWTRMGDNHVLIVVGRHKEDNEKLVKLIKKGDVKIELGNEVGPTTLIRAKNKDFKIKTETEEMYVPEEIKMSEFKLGENKNENEILEIAKVLTGHYAVKARGKKVNFKILSN